MKNSFPISQLVKWPWIGPWAVLKTKYVCLIKNIALGITLNGFWGFCFYFFPIL